MNYHILVATVISIAWLCALSYAAFINPRYVEKKECHTFQRTETSHIRLNSCTGEAHVVVRGPNGFEWQRIIE